MTILYQLTIEASEPSDRILIDHIIDRHHNKFTEMLRTKPTYSLISENKTFLDEFEKSLQLATSVKTQVLALDRHEAWDESHQELIKALDICKEIYKILQTQSHLSLELIYYKVAQRLRIDGLSITTIKACLDYMVFVGSVVYRAKAGGYRVL